MRQNSFGNKKGAGDLRTAIALGTSVLLGNYCFVAFVYVTSQLAENAYAAKFWFKSLVRYPVSSTLGIALVFLPSLILLAAISPPLLSRLKSQFVRIGAFAAGTLITYLAVTVIVQLSLYPHHSWHVRHLVLLTILHCVGAGVAMAVAKRNHES
jgi:hypothetical protein